MKNLVKTIVSLVLVQSIMACNQASVKTAAVNKEPINLAEEQPVAQETPKGEVAYFASGCFWCVEAIYESVEGVNEAVSGYAGGTEKNPTYEEVSRGNTSHAEAVKVIYNPKKVNFKTLVKVYYASQNPTTVNGQAPDFGKQYRSIIFYQNAEEQQIAQAYKDSLDASNTYSEPVATEIKEIETFWRAEEYHQDYEHKNPNNPYIKKVSIPRLNRFKAKMPEVLKDKQH